MKKNSKLQIAQEKAQVAINETNKKSNRLSVLFPYFKSN